MYAHQVIEDLSTLKLYPKNEEYERLMAYVASMIKSEAIVFSLGDMNNGSRGEMFDPVIGRPLFTGDNSNNMGLPYPVTYIDWAYRSPTSEATKGGILATQCTKKPFIGIQVFVLTTAWRPNESGLFWEVCPQSLFISNEGLSRTIVPGFKIDEIGPQFELTMLDRFLKIINCKNITTVDNPPPEKLNKKRAKKGKCPLFTYKTLVIKPTGKKQSSQEAQGLWENRVHLCRGHFKNYTEDNPLFGKYTGRYWWQPSVRGNKKKGVVMKDYRVETGD
jgi:hypothetical protein